MKHKKKIKILKPVETDAHFRYVCKNPDCGYTHWLSLKEVQTTNFKVVCDCGFVFKPKQISKIIIAYKKDKEKAPPIIKAEAPKQRCFVDLASFEKELDLDLDTEKECVKILVGYGFTKSESEQLVRNSFRKNPTNDCVILIKQTLETLGENSDEERDSSV